MGNKSLTKDLILQRQTYKMASSLKRLNTTYTKDNDNPVQVDVNKISLYRSLNKKHSKIEGMHRNSSKASLRRRNSMKLERKMREKTAHIGKKASFASQGIKWSW